MSADPDSGPYQTDSLQHGCRLSGPHQMLAGRTCEAGEQVTDSPLYLDTVFSDFMKQGGYAVGFPVLEGKERGLN